MKVKIAGQLVILSLFAACLLGFAASNPAEIDPWRKALPPYEFKFDRDHAAHPEYKVEWWYYTGNLNGQDGRRFGYQLTFFRVGVDYSPRNPSRWTVRDLYMTHLALTDIDGDRFYHAEKLNRAGVGWAGAAVDRYHVWNEEWEARQDQSGKHLLLALDEKFGIEFELDEGKPAVAHGRRGVSQKGSAPGNASHYYSLTRMPTRGTLLLNGERVKVEGSSWMDHEFGTSFLEKGQLGWDWFSIQLDDGTDLMLYRFRREGGLKDVHSSGAVVLADGSRSTIGFDQFDLEPLEKWRSPASGANYPISWMIAIPGEEIELKARAALNDQELRTSQSTGVTYWEGSIAVDGKHLGRPVKGRGYLEMTGYAGSAMGVLSD